MSCQATMRCGTGVAGVSRALVVQRRRHTAAGRSRLEGRTAAGESPVVLSWRGRSDTTQVPWDTRNPAGIREDHLLRLNTLTHR